MKNINSIMFDLDGTLWDTIDISVSSLAEVKNKYHEITHDITAADVISGMGLPIDDIIKKFFGYINKDKATIYAMEAFNKNIEKLLEHGGTLYPNLESTIKELSKKYKLCIVSNCVEGYIESFLKSSGLTDYFCDFECNGKTKLSKGENIRLVMNRNNIKTAVFVGDTISDKEAANYANISFVYASYGFGTVNEYDYKINDLNDLITLF